MSSVIAIDAGTTSTRAIRFGSQGEAQAAASHEVTQILPRSGWVEHDPEDLWGGALATLREVLTGQVKAIGIANQRETILLWDRRTGRALHNAIVWQDRRTAPLCEQLARDGIEPMIQSRTGLPLDPYFSASKLRWLLDTIPGARKRAERGELAAGTVDSFLLWRLTDGRVHATDVTNASRTMLYDIVRLRWDSELLRLFDIPAAVLPEVQASDHMYGCTSTSVVGASVPLGGIAGDQQAALIGQRCFNAGMAKSTFGTGGFLLVNIGGSPRFSSHRLITTPAYSMGNTVAYAMEGSLFVAGGTIKWLSDRMNLLGHVADSAQLAESVALDHGIHLVPAFVGLGAPHWRSDVRASVSGLTLDTTPAHIARAALEATAFQSSDLIDTMVRDQIARPALIRADGGMARNEWFMQFLADILDLPVERPDNHQATAAGAAHLAWICAGCEPPCPTRDDVAASTRVFTPQMPRDIRERLLAAWHQAVSRLLAR